MLSIAVCLLKYPCILPVSFGNRGRYGNFRGRHQLSTSIRRPRQKKSSWGAGHPVDGQTVGTPDSRKTGEQSSDGSSTRSGAWDACGSGPWDP